MKRVPVWLAGAAVAVLLSLPGLFDSMGRGQERPTHYDVQSDTVRDLGTGLTWQRAVPAGGLSFAAAGQYCADLSLGGADDWRLPSMQEFQTLVDEGRANPSIDPLAFPATPAEGFWSSTVWSGTPALAWHVDFDVGGAAYDSGTMLYRARCVRWQP